MFSAFDNDCPAGQATTATKNNRPKPGQRSRQQPGSACEECRKKRIRCDRVSPQCSSCVKSGVKCVVRSTCPPRGPKKGYLRDLQRQIEDLQTRLNEQRGEDGALTNNAASPSHQASSSGNEDGSSECANEVERVSVPVSTDLGPNSGNIQTWSVPFPPLEGIEQLGQGMVFPAFDQAASGLTSTPAGLGLEVHLTSMICTDLDQLYFDRVHTFAPMLQKFRYLSWSRQPGKTKERTCLQYAMWTLASSVSSQFQLIRLDLYAEARQLLESLDVHSQDHQCLEQVQAWILLSIYELTSNMCNYQRGMVSAGRAFRLVQLMRLNEMDGPSHAAMGGQATGEYDWIDIESMRRTFWVAYTIDRFTSAIDGLPLTFNERHILTRLPAPNSNFMTGRSTSMCFLSEVLNGIESERLNDNMSSPFIQCIVVATICGRTLEHKQTSHVVHRQQQLHSYRTEPEQGISLNDLFRRHQALKVLLTRYIQFLSSQVASMTEQPDPTLTFVAATAYAAVLMLCEAVEPRSFRADAQMAQLAEALHMEHKEQSLDAAHKLGMLTIALGQINHFQTHPFTPIPLLLSARFCLKQSGLNDPYSHIVPGISAALEGLADVNGLARNCLRLLNFKRSEPYKTD